MKFEFTHEIDTESLADNISDLPWDVIFSLIIAIDENISSWEFTEQLSATVKELMQGAPGKQSNFSEDVETIADQIADALKNLAKKNGS